MSHGRPWRPESHRPGLGVKGSIAGTLTMATDRVLPPGSSPRPGACAPWAGDFASLKERQLVFLLARQLAEAQFRRADRCASERLWQEVAALEIDPERITALLYGADDLNDTAEMERIDSLSRRAPGQAAQGWLGRFGMGRLSWSRGGGAHRSAPPADPRARRPVG
jgi:hypothetical protein